jgi:apoptotic chromatin condensation inducer in the nucleus
LSNLFDFFIRLMATEVKPIIKPDETLVSESTKIAKSIREWDIPKLAAAGAEKRPTNGETTSNKKLKTSDVSETNVEETAPKTLDDLFRKTKATPHIYWLPLTDEQFLAKEAAFEQRQIERAERMEQRKIKDAEIEVSCVLCHF